MAGAHGRHGVVEKKQLGVGNKVWIGKNLNLRDGKLTIMLYKTDGGECSWV